MATLIDTIKGILGYTGNPFMTDADRAMLAVKNLSSNPKGGWNASTNTTTSGSNLTATPSPAGDAYDVTVAGNSTFAGGNFSTGQAFAIGDQIKSNFTAWYRVPANFIPTDGVVTNAKLAAAAVDYTKTAYFQGRVLGSRKITLNLQAKTLTVAASSSMLAGKAVISFTAGTVDVSAELDLNPGYSKFCYWDLATSTLQFKDFTNFNQPNCILLFVYDSGLILTANLKAVVLLDTSGSEVAQNTLVNSQVLTAIIANAAVDHTKTAYYQGRLLGSRLITVNLQAKTLTVAAGTVILAGKTAITLPSGTTDISTELNLNPSFSKFCYWDLTTSTLQFKDFTTTAQPNCILLFVLNANVVTAINPQAVIVLNSSGTEVWPISTTLPDGSVTTIKLATASVDHTKSAYYQGRLLGNRLITVNLQAKTLIVAANTYVTAGKTIISIPAGTTDISTELNTNPANVKLCYWDLSTSSLQFKDFGSTTTANCVMLFYLYNNVITAINGGAIIVLNSSGTEVWPIASSSVPADGSISTAKLAAAAVDHTKTSYYQGRVLGSRRITVSLQAKTLTVIAGSVLLAGKTVITLPGGTTDISTELNLNPSYSKFCYWDLSTSTLQFKDFTTTTQPNCVLLFILDGTMIQAVNLRAIVLLDASGVEVSQNSFSASQLTAASIDYTKNYVGDETNERLVLPDTMYFIQGEKLPVYKAQIVGGRDYLEQLKVAVCNEPVGGTPTYNFIYEDFLLDPAVLPASFRFYMRQNYNLDYAYYKPVNRVVRSASAVSGMSVKILEIGDSITEGAIPMWLRNKLTGYGVTVTTLGTRGVNSSEGRGSWNTGHLIGRKNFVENTVIVRVTNTMSTTKYQNPFLKVADSTDKANYPQYCFRNTGAADELNYVTDTDKTGNFYIFDFAFYLTNTLTATPDVVTVAHLTNNLSPLLNTPAPDAATLYQQLDDEMEFIIRQIYLAAPSVKMGIIPQPAVGFAGVGGNGRWKVNSVGVDRLGAKVRSLKSSFPNLYLVGIWPHICPDTTFSQTTTANALNSYNNSIKQQKNENLHPNDFGRAEYANALAAWFVNIL